MVKTKKRGRKLRKGVLKLIEVGLLTIEGACDNKKGPKISTHLDNGTPNFHRGRIEGEVANYFGEKMARDVGGEEFPVRLTDVADAVDCSCAHLRARIEQKLLKIR